MAPDLRLVRPSSSASPTNPAVSSTMAEPANHNMPRSESPAAESPRSATTSLQAAATLNLGLHHEAVRSNSGGSPVPSAPRTRRQSSATTPGRRQSVVLMNLHLNDPSVPAPGEMVHESSHVSNGYTTASPGPLAGAAGSPMMLPRDPHHQRTPSLGELHQELEAEQEAQVNRLLQTIRQQQLQLLQLQAANGQHPEESAVSSQNGETPPSGHPVPNHSSSSIAHPRAMHPRSSFDLARVDINSRQSRTSSRGASPRLRATSISGEADNEAAFYQAETAMLIRENQMLRHRIKELEKQLSDPSSPASITHEPSHHSHLLQATSADRGATPVPPQATTSK